MPRHPFLSESEITKPSGGCCLFWVAALILFWGGVAAALYCALNP